MLAKDLLGKQESQEQDDKASDRGREDDMSDLKQPIDAVACSQHCEDAGGNQDPCPHQ